MHGTEWLIDAYGCDPEALRDPGRLSTLFDRVVGEFGLTPVAPPVWHRFPPPGGITGFVMLAESHLACHTFPEFGTICLDVFCCRPLPAWDASGAFAELIGATSVTLRSVERRYAPDEVPSGR